MTTASVEESNLNNNSLDIEVIGDGSVAQSDTRIIDTRPTMDKPIDSRLRQQ